MICAHSLNDRGDRHELVTHLQAVAALASEFATPLGAADPAHYLGLWHDLGKFHSRFQDYLRACEQHPAARGRGPDHKAAGASLALQHRFGLAALLIQAHHGGLQTPVDFKNWLDQRTTDPAVAESLHLAREAVQDLEPAEPPALPAHTAGDPLGTELLLRLLFSALVDADYLDTERHFQVVQAEQRGSSLTLADLWERFAADQQQFSGERDDVVSLTRNAIYAACLAAAEERPGLFRLTVPTGGGKTRSAMAFALRHALRHGHRRVIVAVPFITITEQTVDVYRGIFERPSDDWPAVLEHHSGARDVATIPAAPGGRSGAGPPRPAPEAADGDSEDFHAGPVWARLAAENWDAPIVVTTTVQLFESLFSSRTSSSRKLHRLADAVVILDEAQALPIGLLTPILDALRELCTHHGTTVVLSTATQPAFEVIAPFAALPAREIVPEPERTFAALRRVRYEWRTDPPLEWAEVAAIIREAPQALAVVNTKNDALALLHALDDSTALHLSTLLCGAHRREVIREVRQRLASDQPCHLVSTQVVEAGVDLDFPLVLRALGPLDGIIQAAGRCNREGRLDHGRVVVFRPAAGGLPQGAYRTAADVTASLLGDDLDPDSPALSRAYFARLFRSVDTDAQAILGLRRALDYPEVARRFRMIDDDTESVVVAYGSEAQQAATRMVVERLRRGAPDARLLLRRLQPFVVSVRRRAAERLTRRGLITAILPGLGEWHGRYDHVTGLVVEDVSPEDLVI